MGCAFDGKLNRNSERNDEAMSGGSILDSHCALDMLNQEPLKKRECNYLIRRNENG